MGHRLYDITLYYCPEKYKDHGFTIRQNLISGIYVRFLDTYKPKGISRISVTLGDKDYIQGYFGSILTVYAAFNEQEYWESNSDRQNYIILDAIHRVAMLCADKYSWDKTVFDNAYKKTVACGFIDKHELKRKLSKDRKHQASLLIEKDGAAARISVQFYDENGNFIRSTELLKSFHLDWFYGNAIKINKWLNEHEFGIFAKNSQLIIKGSLNNPGPEIIFIPLENSRAQLEDYLHQITFRECFDETDRIRFENTTGIAFSELTKFDKS